MRLRTGCAAACYYERMTPLFSPPEAGVLPALLHDLSSNPGALVVFDLDDTLLSTVHRHRRILMEYSAHPAVVRRFPGVLALRRLPLSCYRYLIADTAREAGLSEPALLEDLKAFWFARFFRNEYLEADEPIPGATGYCREVERRGGTVVYLTGRDEAMRAGTEASLERHGFPVPDGRAVRLVLKPRFEMADHEFKAGALRALAALGPVAGGFENEPGHANLLAATFPAAKMVLVGSRHSGKPVVLDARVPRVPDFLI